MKTNIKNAYQLFKVNRSLSSVKEPVIRERLLLLKQYYQGSSLRSTGEHHRCSHHKVLYWKQRYESEGLKGLETKSVSGRPSRLKPPDEKKISSFLVKNSVKSGWNIKYIREYVQKEGGVLYSLRHTMRLAQKWGMGRITPRPIYAHTNMKERAAFLKE